jgi:hypothetical protein
MHSYKLDLSIITVVLILQFLLLAIMNHPHIGIIFKIEIGLIALWVTMWKTFDIVVKKIKS